VSFEMSDIVVVPTFLLQFSKRLMGTRMKLMVKNVEMWCEGKFTHMKVLTFLETHIHW
jgi:hypothetical protein